MALVHAAQDMLTTTGWSTIASPDSWRPAQFLLGHEAFGVVADGAEAPSWVPLAEIVGLDQLSVGDDGLLVLEFALTGHRVIHARLDASFVDETVDALQRSRGADPDEAEPEAEAVVDLTDEPDHDPSGIDDPPPPPARGGSKAALAKEVAALREYLDAFGFPERRALRSDIDSLIDHRNEVLAELRAASAAKRREEVGLVRVRREAVLQDVGVYQPRHPSETSPARRERLAEIRTRIAEIVSAGDAVSTTDDWLVNGSRVEGRKVVDDLAKLLLRTYNAEADVLVETLRPYQVDAAVERLSVTKDTIERLGNSMAIVIGDELHRLRVEELTLAADDLAATVEAATVVDPAVPGSGYLYVVTNVGALGDDVVRVGTTTVADPAELVAELDGRHLPFRSDVHALVPSADASALLTDVRDALDTRRVNLVDPACEFFAVAPSQVVDVLTGLGVTVPWFVEEPLAEEWHQTDNARHPHE